MVEHGRCFFHVGCQSGLLRELHPFLAERTETVIKDNTGIGPFHLHPPANAVQVEYMATLHLDYRGLNKAFHETDVAEVSGNLIFFLLDIFAVRVETECVLSLPFKARTRVLTRQEGMTGLCHFVLALFLQTNVLHMLLHLSVHLVD